MVVFYVAYGYNIAFAVRNFHLPNFRPVMYEIELRLKIVWAAIRNIGIKFQVICKKFCLDFRVEMVGDIIDEQVEKKWPKTTTLRNAASDRASVWEGRVYSDPLSSIGKKSFDPEKKIALNAITEKFVN